MKTSHSKYMAQEFDEQEDEYCWNDEENEELDFSGATEGDR